MSRAGLKHLTTTGTLEKMQSGVKQREVNGESSSPADSRESGISNVGDNLLWDMQNLQCHESRHLMIIMMMMMIMYII